MKILRLRRLPVLGGVAAILGCSALSAGAQNQKFGPDQLHTLGVGARAFGMGSAYTVVANDSSATFWNPAQLYKVRRNQFDIEFRSVSYSQFSTTGVPGNLTSTLGISGKAPQLNYLGVAIPLKYGTLGISYALGGYADLRSSSMVTTTGFVPNPSNPIGADLSYTLDETNTSDTLVRNSYITFAYGVDRILTDQRRIASGDNITRERIPYGRLAFGAGLVYVNQNYLLNQTNQIESNLPTIVPSSPLAQTRVNESGNSLGYIIGVTYRGVKPSRSSQGGAGDADVEDNPLAVGLSYRNRQSLSGLRGFGQIFNQELPDRLALGLAYETRTYSRPKDLQDERRPRDRFVFAAEIQRMSAANTFQQNVDARRQVTNYHFGIEAIPYVDPRRNQRYSIRLGFRTIENANTTLFSYDNAISFGGSYQITDANNVRFSFEPAFEYLTNSGLLQYAFSARFRF